MIDFRFLYDRIRLIMVKPRLAWQNVKDEERKVSTVRSSYLLPLVILVSLAGFTGSMIYSYSSLSILFPILIGVKIFLSFFITVQLSSWLLTELSQAFVLEKSYSFNYKLVSYGITPLMLTIMLSRFFPMLAVINTLGLYGAYIVWTGLDTIDNFREGGQLRYLVATILTVALSYFTISWLCGTILEGLYFTILG